MEFLPAILIGGPPHSGKSVLAYSLRQALTALGVIHYLLRAYPDGEGNWSNESTPTLVQQLRVKGKGSHAWVDAICQDIEHRELPLLVDVGGKPTFYQEKIFSRCTHAILLSPNATTLAQWQSYAQKYSLTILAELNSTLDGTNYVQETSPILRGEITDLHRHSTAHGTSFDALMTRLVPLMHYPETELRQMHLNAAPTDTVIDLDRLANTLNIGEYWHPTDLETLKNYLPAKRPLAIYGGKANWIYTALAHHSFPAPFYQFDPRLGWISPLSLRIGTPPNDSPVHIEQLKLKDNYHYFKFFIQNGYLNYRLTTDITVPPLSPGHSLIIDGKLPHWLTTALVRRYADAPLLAVFQPQLNGSVVIHTTNNLPPIGTIL